MSSLPIPASSVDPNTIVETAQFGLDADIMLRNRPPGSVALNGGHAEHLLMCTRGRPIEGKQVYSKLAADGKRFEWSTCPLWDITFIPAGMAVNWQWSYRSESIHLAIKPQFLERIAEQVRAEGEVIPSLQPSFRQANRLLSESLHRLQSETRSGRLLPNLMSSSLMNLIGAQLCFHSEPPLQKTMSHRLSATLHIRSKELIHDRLTENLSLQELAAEANLSPYHFSRQFKLSTGYPPHEYQLRLRIQKAKEWLREKPFRPIAEIAISLGFSDESHFRRHFKRITGSTPSRYRK